ncbi:aldo/keto reductase [Rhizophagus clarus]|uniref:Aldo/keto reductase n=1 Tax=Rhizophagus clarus TaxID=94130 RepID=A0A8H3M8B1_9GLOM|nr:aldo/keto reductase [Rhizophagus clarus]
MNFTRVKIKKFNGGLLINRKSLANIYKISITIAQDFSSTKITKALDDYVLLGRSGLRVSPLCLNTSTFGEQWEVGINKEESKKVFDLYYENGGNFFANTTATQKDERFNPNFGGNHQKSLIENLDESLKRLNMSYVDILYIHAYEFRIPIEEFMRSLDDVVRSGKVRIIPWGVIAEGFLAGKYTKESAKSEIRGQSVARHSKVEKSWKILDEVITVSKEINRSPVRFAQLEENLKSLEFKLTPEQMKRLDEASRPAEIPFPYSFVSSYDRFLGKH